MTSDITKGPLFGDQKEYKFTKKHMTALRRYNSVRINAKMKAEIDFDLDFDQFRYLVESLEPADRIETAYFSGRERYIPKNTWQMFKHQHEHSFWLHWFVKRRPVKMKDVFVSVTVQVDRYLYYPEMRIPPEWAGQSFVWENVREVFGHDV